MKRSPLNSHFLLSEKRDTDFWKMSKTLDEFYRRDFSSIVDSMKGLFPRSWQNRLQADVPLVETMCKSIAVQYREPPSRRYLLPSGEYISRPQSRALSRLYKALNVNNVFKVAAEKLVVQRTMTGVILPQPGTNRSAVMVFSPFEVEVDAHPLLNEDPQAVEEYRFRVPMRADYEDIEYGLLRMNKEGAFYEFRGKKTGVYREDGSYPEEFEGRYPVFVFRLGSPPKASWFCSLASDAMTAQQILSLCTADAIHSSRYASWGQRVMVNGDRNQVDSITMGPETIVGIDDDQELKIINGKANSQDYLNTIDHYLKYVTHHNNLNPSVFTKFPITGLSKQMDLFDRQSMRMDMVQSLQAGEQSFYDALRLVLNAGVRSNSWPVATLEVQYQVDEMPQNVLQEAQARVIDWKAGISSPFEYVAHTRGISLEEARELVERNAEEYRTLEAAGMVEE